MNFYRTQATLSIVASIPSAGIFVFPQSATVYNTDNTLLYMACNEAGTYKAKSTTITVGTPLKVNCRKLLKGTLSGGRYLNYKMEESIFVAAYGFCPTWGLVFNNVYGYTFNMPDKDIQFSFYERNASVETGNN